MITTIRRGAARHSCKSKKQGSDRFTVTVRYIVFQNILNHHFSENNADETLSDDFVLKTNADEALGDDFFL
jgi:hypothetical protein